jgi:osmoprotectant transport system permease protein
MSGILSWLDFVRSRWGEVVGHTIDHAVLVVSVVVTATIFAVVVGVLVRGRSGPRAFVIGLAGVGLTIPSLALFTLFIPIVGLGFTPVFLALFIYALLPVLRNTVTGLEQVDPAVIESAKGMGMNRRQRLVRIQLPLAWPVIMAGVRVSALLTTGIAAIGVLVAGPGLGEFIKDGLRRLGLPNSMEAVWTGTVFIILLALTIDLVLMGIQRLTTSRGLR